MSRVVPVIVGLMNKVVDHIEGSQECQGVRIG